MGRFSGHLTKRQRRATRWSGALIVVLLMVGVLMAGMTYQADTLDERVSMRLGPGDSNHDIIQEMESGEYATFILTNLDEEEPVHVVIIELEQAAKSMGEGDILWEKLKDQATTVSPGETRSFLIEDQELWHLAIVHLNDSAQGIVEVHITVEYSLEDMVTNSLIMSMPSLWMTGWVLHRLARLKWDGRSWIDSTPSHAWVSMGESE